MKKLDETKFYTLSLWEDTHALYFRWKPETIDLDDNGFQEALSSFSGYAIEYGTKNVVVDLTSFRGTPSAAIAKDWRRKVTLPRYNKVIRKFAYFNEAGSASAPVQNDGERFETATFTNISAMEKWLGAGRPGKPVTWFEVYAKDAKKSQKFYADLFDWSVDTNYPMGYGIVQPESRGIRGGIGQANEMIPVKGATFYVEVGDLKAYLAKAEQLGGRTTLEPFQIPGGPQIAIFTDLDGHPIGLTEPDPRF